MDLPINSQQGFGAVSTVTGCCLMYRGGKMLGSLGLHRVGKWIAGTQNKENSLTSKECTNVIKAAAYLGTGASLIGLGIWSLWPARQLSPEELQTKELVDYYCDKTVKKDGTYSNSCSMVRRDSGRIQKIEQLKKTGIDAFSVYCKEVDPKNHDSCMSLHIDNPNFLNNFKQGDELPLVQEHCNLATWWTSKSDCLKSTYNHPSNTLKATQTRLIQKRCRITENENPQCYEFKYADDNSFVAKKFTDLSAADNYCSPLKTSVSQFGNNSHSVQELRSTLKDIYRNNDIRNCFDLVLNDKHHIFHIKNELWVSKSHQDCRQESSSPQYDCLIGKLLERTKNVILDPETFLE
jgi:hypothetical protein